MKNQTYCALLFELNEIYFGQFIQLYLKKNVKQDHNLLNDENSLWLLWSANMNKIHQKKKKHDNINNAPMTSVIRT